MSFRASISFARASAAFLLACGLAPYAAAQTRDPAPRTGDSPAQAAAPAERPSPDSADLSITARVTARELLFRKVPNPKVEFTGRPERNTLWEAERENLPEQVQPGVTYRNVGITLRIVSVFADIDRIVAEALGEVPADDSDATTPDATPSPAPPETTQSAAPARAPSDTSRRAARRPGSNGGRRAARTPE